MCITEPELVSMHNSPFALLLEDADLYAYITSFGAARVSLFSSTQPQMLQHTCKEASLGQEARMIS